MTYQVLARKWRPQNFQQMIGQQHVLQALVNALKQDRLHHAYLFSGTRGIGKTTIARILAKCLNCEQGTTAEPCGDCASCQSIAQGNDIDLIEVDAASRTKVEDTRELLENVQYAPTRSRYKVYLIDEVHMLSNHSFNALLKTLEEPPAHVKFLLATTDPDKLPITILSRCLQFNLQPMLVEQIHKHLQHILKQEDIQYEDSALWEIAEAAKGSMRDALSLLDQAIAYTGLNITTPDVKNMLGTLHQAHTTNILEALAQQDASALISISSDLAEAGTNFKKALEAIINTLHDIAIYQAIPNAQDTLTSDKDNIRALAEKIPAEDLQLFYQIALNGQRDLGLSPDPRRGFEMVLLRMLSFQPQRSADVPPKTIKANASKTIESNPLATSQDRPHSKGAINRPPSTGEKKK